MGILNIVLVVFFVIVAILLVLLVLVQNEEGDSLGGIFAGGSGSAFGSRSGNVLTRATTVLGALFLIISLGLALINRSPGVTGVEAAGRQLSTDTTGANWVDEELKSSGGAVSEEAVSGSPDFDINAEKDEAFGELDAPEAEVEAENGAAE
jgi:preprotein translocase subunit SecG